MNAPGSELSADGPDSEPLRRRFHALAARLESRIVGQSELIRNLLIGFCCGGHVLLEGLPGLAKTTTVRLLAQALGLGFGRVQMTPDIMPGDIIGSSFLKPDFSGFIFHPGPIFQTILLVDELNRAPAKVQSALLEAMQEGQVTVAGQTHALSELFWVVATQNPIDQEGTYPLAESQKDRFLLRLKVGYPEISTEAALMATPDEPLAQAATWPDSGITPAEIRQLRQQISRIHCAPVLAEWVAKVVWATRQPARLGLNEKVLWGVSPRGGRMWVRAARARAWWQGRDYVAPEDLRMLADSVLGHRIVEEWSAAATGRAEGQSLVDQILERIGPP